ncbi:phage tail protein [Sphingobium sp. HDIP04]|uniref:phage tail protein n=1 Tax=Sphingobium sp. HDIP04 TaxID=428994 RepID=UPI000A028AEA|nr:tail fiber protein [Sphingobium sp. HDIP04]
MQDIAQALGNSLDRNGSGGMRAPLNMGGYSVQNAGNGSAPSDLATVAQIGLTIPVGSVLDFAGTIAPDTFLLAYGQEISRTDYAELFGVIGTTFGDGNGSTTFHVPDLRGRVAAGKDDMGGSSAQRLSFFGGNNLGFGPGSQTHELTIDEMPAHSHSGATGSAGNHNHTYTASSGGLGALGYNPQGNGSNQNTQDAGAHTHSFTTNNTGGGLAHANVQPTLILNKIIKARSS